MANIVFANDRTRAQTRRPSAETKASLKTTEPAAYVAALIGVLVAAATTDASDFGTQEAWFYVVLLTIGDMVSRGLASSAAATTSTTPSVAVPVPTTPVRVGRPSMNLDERSLRDVLVLVTVVFASPCVSVLRVVVSRGR